MSSFQSSSVYIIYGVVYVDQTYLIRERQQLLSNGANCVPLLSVPEMSLHGWVPLEDASILGANFPLYFFKYIVYVCTLQRV